jgi:type IV pilus assembly protein PilO
MGLREQLQALNEIDVAELDLSELGLWPAPARWALGGLVLALTLFAGYVLLLAPAQDVLAQAQRQEVQLREAIETQAPYAAAVPQLRAQQREIAERFDRLLRQLPSETEVPALLEDISRAGTDSGLRFRAIDLKPAREEAYYDVLPLEIRIEGGYHDLARFISGISGLSRIVTLHDFSLRPGGSNDVLQLQLEARTYRYRGEVEP